MKSVQRLLMSGSEAIRYAFICASKKVKNLVLISEGVLDPSAFYGTTKGLNRYFKKDRIIEMPLSESHVLSVELTFLYWLDCFYHCRTFF